MKAIFELFLSAGFFGGVMILLVVAARFALRKAPRGIFCLLWVLVGLRLLIPLQIESQLSLQPSFEPVASAPTVAVQPQPTPAPVPAIPDVLPDDVVVPEVLPGDVVINYDNDAVFAPVQRQVDFMEVAAWVWAVGVAAMAGYTVVTYVLLKRKLKDAVAVGGDVYESDAIGSPFLLGYVKPAVYLPKGISEEDRPYILAHEQCHMDRYDNWFKLVGFLCVGLHWFNPLVWLGYHLLCRDIEMACDEAVVRHMDLSNRKGYSAALVSCSTERKFGACPVAFGEVSVKQRVLSVLNYRKPGFWISLACVAVIGFTVVCFMTNPAKDPTDDTLPTNPAELPTERDAITQLCKEAFEAYVGDDIYHIQVDTKYESKSGMMNYYTETEYMRYGEHWYQSYTVFERDFTYSGQDVSYEGKRLQNKYDGEWTQSYDPAEPMGPSAMELDFDRLTYLDTDAASGSRGYCFLLDGDEENAITFCFDGSGKLTYLLHSFDLVTEMDTISHVTVNCRLQSTTDSEILQNIEWYYRSAHSIEIDPLDFVEQCKNAVSAIKNADSYSFVVQYQTNDPDILLRRDTMKYWYSDGNYLACHAATDWENWYLDYNGKYYRKTVTDSMPPEDVNYGNWMSVVESGRNFLGLPWFMNENWGGVILTPYEVNGQWVISFTADESESGKDHTVTFRFDSNNGSLISIERMLTYESNGTICTSYSVVSDIRLNQADIGALIEQQYQETQLQVIE